ncbi:hypothetical protein TSTA_122950 [Talaromyces stipitatus ATCC 10500]|uniref:Uncharacterized protein n=1 Tax=Talaromyces stipitatus (strain ATCC 10500 / CBS 375.48 / QM 6759 / NRRL 1006) TaxID=441959 RepID=B8MCC0_TALSN|nr:uncharacterized protein TSTA_122950 [Talaromyces stipitatus ATCC 10500]EED18566.1 hypothetical protein TSTA_122950 [Talaromyces stipitatus ATCC 10500]
MFKTSANPSGSYLPFFDLYIKDINQKQPLKLDEGLPKRMWLMMGTLGSKPQCPSQKTKIVEGGMSGHLMNFNPKNAGPLHEFLRPRGGNNGNNEIQRYAQPLAVAKDAYQMVLCPFNLEPGKWEYEMVGEFNFTYKDGEGESEGNMRMEIDITFWFEVEKNGENARKTLKILEMKPPQIAYYAEKEGRLMPVYVSDPVEERSA